MKLFVRQYYHIFSNLSLDVVLGVWCNLLPLPICLGFIPPEGWYQGLCLLSWAVYLIDHLADLKINPEMNSPRHDFMRASNKSIKILLVVIFIVLLFTVHLPPPTLLLKAGLLTSSICLLYFIFLMKPTQPCDFSMKEPAVAIVYALGIYSVPLLASEFHWVTIVFAFVFLGIAIQNLLMNSILEIRADLINLQPTVVIHTGYRKSIRFFTLITCFLMFTIAALIVLNIQRELAVIYGVMMVSTTLLFRTALSFSFNNQVRLAGEMIFWFPGIWYVLMQFIL